MGPETATNLYLGTACFIVLVVLPLVAEYFQRQRRKGEYQAWVDRLEAVLPTLEAEAKNYFENSLRHADQEQFDTVAISTPGFQFVDIRSKTEKLIERDAQEGLSLGSAFDGLVTELNRIGKYSKFTDGGTGSTEFENGCNRRARRIGDLLHRGGGFNMMQAAHYRVKVLGGDARDLERCWAGIGNWRS